MQNVSNLYPSNVSDKEWASVVPYLVLMHEEHTSQRTHELHEVFDAFR